jgi:hypothetical protein
LALVIESANEIVQVDRVAFGPVFDGELVEVFNTGGNRPLSCLERPSDRRADGGDALLEVARRTCEPAPAGARTDEETTAPAISSRMPSGFVWTGANIVVTFSHKPTS